MTKKDKVEITTDLRNIRRISRTPAGKQSELVTRYINLFNTVLDEWEKLIMHKCYIEGKSYYVCAMQMNNCSEKTIYRAVQASIKKIEEFINKKE